MRPSRGKLPQKVANALRISPALALAMMLGVTVSDGFAQESGLRGTVNEPVDPLADPLVKGKPKKKTRLEAAQTATAQPIPRYEPADLDPDTQASDEAGNSDNATAADAAPVRPNRTATASQQPGSVGTTGNPTLDNQATGTAAADPDVPDPSGQTVNLSSGSPDADALDNEDIARARRDNLRETPIEGLDRTDDIDPYAAPGIAAGTFTLRPTLEQGMRWTSNADLSSTGGEAVISETNIRLRAESNWARHRLNLEATGGFRKSVSGEDVSDPDFGLAADLQLDVSTATQINARASWDRSKESASAPALMTGSFTRPDLDTLRASVGVNYDPGLFGASATAQVTRQAYGTAKDALGVSVPQDDRNNTFASLTLRGSYDLSPSLTPFVEVEMGRRIFDKEVDSFGLERSANRYGIRAGVAANLGEKLTGEFAAGWLTEDIDDPVLADVSGLDLRGTMNWSPHRGANLAFSLATTIEGSTLAASSGSVLYSANATLTRNIRDNLEANVALGSGWRIYEAGAYQDTILSGEAGMTWWMNRYAGLNGRVRHEQVLNADPARAYGATSVYLGVTLRR